MRELYIVDCGSYTDKCFEIVCWMLSEIVSIEVVEIDREHNIATITTADDKSVETLKKMLEMGDMGEVY